MEKISKLEARDVNPDIAKEKKEVVEAASVRRLPSNARQLDDEGFLEQVMHQGLFRVDERGVRRQDSPVLEVRKREEERAFQALLQQIFLNQAIVVSIDFERDVSIKFYLRHSGAAEDIREKLSPHTHLLTVIEQKDLFGVEFFLVRFPYAELANVKRGLELNEQVNVRRRCIIK